MNQRMRRRWAINGLSAVVVPNPSATALADKLVSEVEAAYRVGGSKIKLNPDRIALFLTGPVGAVASIWLKSQGQITTEASYAKHGDAIKKWRTTYRKWAEAGRRDDGTAYDWPRWVAFGKELLSGIKDYTGYSWQSSVVIGAAKAVKQTVVDIKTTVAECTESPLKCALKKLPWWALAGGAVVGGVALLYAVNRVRGNTTRIVVQKA
jgi:hypothetical protein